MFLAVACLLSLYQPLTVGSLKCESVVDPMNVDVQRPNLSWVISSNEEGQRQTAFQVLVSSSRQKLDANKGDLWDTGRDPSSATLEVPYKGKDLTSAEQVFWKVRTWDAHNKVSSWSEPGTWTMGLLKPSDWHTKWIGATAEGAKAVTLFFRKQFHVSKSIRRALVFASGLGQYEMWLNGKKVGEDWLTPGWTQYAKTVLADSYDVTSLLKPGANVAAIHVGNGMYDMSLDKRGGQQNNSLGTKKTVCQLMVEFNDGTHQTFGTDASWRWTPSPETYSGVYGGEDWDARKDPYGWKLTGYDDHNWKVCEEVSPPSGLLRGLTHANPPLRLIETRSPVKQTSPRPNTLVLDLGQNSPYVPKFTVQGEAGTTIRFYPAERLNADGTVDQQTMRAGKFTSYTLAGGTAETWHPSFWYVGARYWQVIATDPSGKSIDPKPILTRFVGLLVHADVKPAGVFSCSNKLFNQTHDLIWWAMCSNFASVISDCPHREKSGWLEEDHLVGPGLMYAFDMGPMFRKVVQDMTDTQLPNGMVPTMAPEYFLYDGGFRDSVEWGGSYLLLPVMMQEWYGKQGIVAEHYDAMKRYVDYLGTKANNGILSNGLGDWDGGGTDPRTPVGITDTAYYFRLTKSLAGFAKSLGKKEDVSQYLALAEQIRLSFLHEFFDPSTGKVGKGSQSSQATALDFDMIDPADQAKAFDQLLADVAEHHYQVSCGEVGHPSLLHVLTRFGRSDIVAKIHLQTEKRGYGYQIKLGMTTLTESWDAAPNSYNHFMLGHLMEWLYGDLVGIRPDPTGSAFSKVFIKPHPVPGVTWAQGSYDSVRGWVSSQWKLSGDRFHMAVTVPPNTSATIYVPTKAGGTVRLTYPKSKAFGVYVSQRPEEGYEPIHVTSGQFVFDSSIR